MPQQKTLNQRRRTSSRAKDRTKSPSTSQTTHQQSRFQQSLLSVIKQVYNLALTAAVGILAAASLTNDKAAIALFVFAVGTVFTALVIVFISILGQKDETLIQLHPIHHADGTVTNRDSLTVLEHDKAIATNFAAELPAFALAAAWVYVWTGTRPIMFIYFAYISYRLLYHPLFRVHLWKEQDGPEFVRPFGAQPLFTKDSAPRVVEVVGKTDLDKKLEEAPSGSLVVLDVSATWCPPCKQMAPIFTSFAEQFPTATFLTCDIDVSQDIAQHLAITSVPSFIFFKDGDRLQLLKGASPQKLGETIQDNL